MLCTSPDIIIPTPASMFKCDVVGKIEVVIEIEKIKAKTTSLAYLESARVNNDGLEVVLDGAGAAAGTLEGTDKVHGAVGLVDLAEDDVLAVEP